jgi:rhamnosyltransferase
VYAVVVLYRPDEVLLHEQYDAIRTQLDGVLYVDNGGGRAGLGAIADEPGVRVLGEGENLGLGVAINQALRDLSTQDARYALLLDQDSIPDPDLVSTLCRGFEQATGAVAAIGPAIIDELEGRPEYFTRLRLPLNTRIRSAADAPAEFFDVDFLITSGSLLNLALLAEVGLMDESLFIDSVDFDWSFHARARGFRLLATFSASMRHRRGDDLHPIPGGRSLRIHSAARMYYMHRNRVRLYTRGYVPLAWKVHDVGRMIVKLSLLLVFVPERGARGRAAVRGIWDGLHQRGGRER